MIRTELNEEELRRHEVLSRVGRKELPLREAAGLLRVSYAQAKRLRKRYREGLLTICQGQKSYKKGQLLPVDLARLHRGKNPSHSQNGS